jgi:AcrR family transcriptional regulator
MMLSAFTSGRNRTVVSLRYIRDVTAETRRVPAGAAVLRDDITAAIREAVVAELAAVGYGRLSIEAVARRAGVGKTAIYRRWTSKLELVLDIVTEVAGQRLPLLDTGSLTGDLEMLLTILSHALRHPLASQIIPDLLAEAARNPKIGQTLQEALQANQRDVTIRLLDRAVERGELRRADPDLAMDLLFGPLYWRLAIARSPLPKGYVSRLAATTAKALAQID